MLPVMVVAVNSPVKVLRAGDYGIRRCCEFSSIYLLSILQLYHLLPVVCTCRSSVARIS